MNGVTGRMGLNQHLRRSIGALIKQGGLKISDSEIILPHVLLIGRNTAKLESISKEFGGLPYTTDLDSALADPKYSIYFDAQTTDRRVAAVDKAIKAGKHVYCEKPTAETFDAAMGLYRRAKAADVKHGVVQDKLWLPGMLKLQTLRDLGFFGKILSVRGEFGYWVFEGDTVPAQRPSWNYRKEDGGGIIIDMLCHWRYVLDNLFGGVKSVSCTGAIHVPERIDENGRKYACTADDSAYATFELEGGVIAHFNSSWTVRVRRDDLLTLQVDGGAAKIYPFTWCSQLGCVARVGFTGAEVDQFRKGAKAVVTIVPVVAPDQKVALDISLKGFTAGFEAVKTANAGTAPAP